MIIYSVVVFVVYFLIGLSYYSWPKKAGCYIFGGFMISIITVFILTLIFGTMAMASSSIPLMLVGTWIGTMLDPKR